jgi:NIPSNAP
MTVYEMRTYTLHVGKMAEAVKLYTEFAYPALQKGGQDKKLIGYFQADTGISSSTSGSSTTMPTVARTGRRCSPTRTSSRALPSNSVRCSRPRRSSC